MSQFLVGSNLTLGNKLPMSKPVVFYLKYFVILRSVAPENCSIISVFAVKVILAYSLHANLSLCTRVCSVCKSIRSWYETDFKMQYCPSDLREPPSHFQRTLKYVLVSRLVCGEKTKQLLRSGLCVQKCIYVLVLLCNIAFQVLF